MTETGRTVERLRFEAREVDPAHKTMLLAKAEVRSLLAVVEAAQEADALLVEAASEATNGLTANPVYIDQLVLRAKGLLGPALKRLHSQASDEGNAQ